jgi:Alanine dehydrogenase/PNT, N-terminal domain
MLSNTIAIGLVVVTLTTTTTTTTFAFAPRSSTTSVSFVTAPTAFQRVIVVKPVQQQQQQQRFPRLFATIEEDATTATTSLKKENDSVAKSFDESDAVVTIIKSKDSSTTLLGEPIPYSQLTIGVLKEVYPGENRVSQTPDSIRTLTKAGMSVVVEKGGAFVYCFVL